MQKPLSGKKCVVTAAAQGIGRAGAERLAAAGAEVIATDINETGLATLRAVSGVSTMHLDVTDVAQINRFAETVGAIDLLFNCAGFVHNGTLLDSTEDEWESALSLNVLSMARMSRAFLPLMTAHGGGVILNMSSVVSAVKGVPNRCVYATTKAAVIGLSKSIAVDFIGDNIRCNAIAPGTVDSPSLHGRLRASGDYEAAKKAFIARQPMGRFARAEEIAALVVYLAGDDAAFITGQTYNIDGGWTI